jgi:hypothetical protein
MNCQIINPKIFRFIYFTNKIVKILNVSFKYVESAGKSVDIKGVIYIQKMERNID